MRKALAVGRKEIRQILRDVRTLLVVLLLPLFLLWLYGYALNFDIKHVRLAVQDRDHSVESRDLVAAFANSGYFDVVASVADDQQINRLMNQDRARAFLIIPEDTGRRLRTGQDAAVQVLINGDNSNTAAVVMGYANTIVQSISATLQAQQRGVELMRPPIAVEPRVWFNPELRSTIFLVPGLIAFIAMLTAVLSTTLSIVREKERGTMEQIRMAPLGTLSYVIGKTIPYFVLSLISSAGILLAGMALFDVPMRGSWLLLLLVTSLFLVGALGFGLLISTLADSQQVAFQIGLLASFLPTMILSGFVFPIASMPWPVQIVTYAVPARYYLRALRGIMLKGTPFNLLVDQFAALTIFSVIVIGLAAIRLAKERE